MSYSIFEETMADMTYQQIEEASKKNLPVLFPIAVIEEHGPHMCLGTDTYLTYNLCKTIKKGLKNLGQESLIVPPYYWGINVATNAFHGSFTVKPDTMIAVLCDTLECLKKWGFDKIFILNFHGDLSHNVTIANAVKKAFEEFEGGVYFVVPEFFFMRSGISKDKPYFIIQRESNKSENINMKPSQYADIHAGGFETSLMIRDYPKLVNIDQARRLESSMTKWEDLKTWAQGGEKAREITPFGYCGNPSETNVNWADDFEKEMIGVVPKLIMEFIEGSKIV